MTILVFKKGLFSKVLFSVLSLLWKMITRLFSFISFCFPQDFSILIDLPHALQNVTDGDFFEFILKLWEFRAESRCPDHGLHIQFSPVTQVLLQTTLGIHLGLHLSHSPLCQPGKRMWKQKVSLSSQQVFSCPRSYSEPKVSSIFDPPSFWKLYNYEEALHLT